MPDKTDARSSNRDRIIRVASSLLSEQGRGAVTTRGVAERAGVQAPMIYRLFGDKDGLVDAVAEHVMASFSTAKASAMASSADIDPVEDLRRGWEMTIDFGLANPHLFVLLNDPTRAERSPAAQAGIRLLAERMHRVALSGRLRVSEDRAVDLIHAAGTGAVLATLAKAPAERDHRIADTLFDAVLGQLITDDSATSQGVETDDVVAHAVLVRAHALELEQLSSSERTLLAEWLDRVIDRRA